LARQIGCPLRLLRHGDEETVACDLEKIGPERYREDVDDASPVPNEESAPKSD
jgi:hypothetical protein